MLTYRRQMTDELSDTRQQKRDTSSGTFLQDKPYDALVLPMRRKKAYKKWALSYIAVT